MNLAYVDPHPVPGLTPSTMQMLQTVDGLGQAGVDVALITPRSTLNATSILGHPLSPRVQLLPQFDPRKRWYFPFSTHKPFFWQAVRLLSNGNFSAVLVRNLKLAHYLIDRLPQLPIFFETHEIFAQSFKEEHQPLAGIQRGKYQRLLNNERVVYNRASGIFALTQLLIDDICRDYSVTHGRCHVLPDGFDPVLAEAALTKFKRIGRQPGPPRILYLGSLHPWKGVGTLVNAMASVPAPIECWIAGGEPGRVEELRRRAKALGIDARLRFLGKIPPAERFDLIAQADICALPLTETSIASRYTSPLKLFEYMALRKPMILADLPSIREVWKHPVGLFAVGNTEDCAKQIGAILQRVANDQIANFYADVNVGAYTWSTRGETIKAVIESILSGGDNAKDQRAI